MSRRRPPSPDPGVGGAAVRRGRIRAGDDQADRSRAGSADLVFHLRHEAGLLEAVMVGAAGTEDPRPALRTGSRRTAPPAEPAGQDRRALNRGRRPAATGEAARRHAAHGRGRWTPRARQVQVRAAPAAAAPMMTRLAAWIGERGALRQPVEEPPRWSGPWPAPRSTTCSSTVGSGRTRSTSPGSTAQPRGRVADARLRRACGAPASRLIQSPSIDIL